MTYLEAREIFVDTGAWIALAITNDPYHQRAFAAYQQLRVRPRRFVTTNLVAAEAYIGIRRGLGHRAAMRFLTSLRETGRLERVYSDPGLEEEAETLLARYDDQDFSFVDAVSFALMRRRRIHEAFAFDRHFLVAGFSLVPAPLP